MERERAVRAECRLRRVGKKSFPVCFPMVRKENLWLYSFGQNWESLLCRDILAVVAV